MKKLFAVLAMSVLALTMTPGHARTVTKPYVGSTDPFTVRSLCNQSGTLGANVGVVCFSVNAGDRTLTVRGTDLVNSAGAYFYYLADANGDCAGSLDPTFGACSSAGFACPNASGISVPSRARTLEVYPLTVLAPTTCFLVGQTSAGVTTTGTITAIFS